MNFAGAPLKGRRQVICMCAWCRRIRNGKGVWKEPEASIKETSRIMVTHGICPACARKLLKDEYPGRYAGKI